MNVDEYLARIGYTGSRELNLSTLKQLNYCHKTSVAFSNLQLFGGERITLDLEKIYDKIVINKQGGICYEINGLFVWLLRKLGFKAFFAHSEIYYEELEEFSEKFYHPVPFVELGGAKYILDAAFVPFGPMKVEAMTPHFENYGIFRFRSVPGEKDWLYLERHRKTVLDADGKVLKQGPATPGVINGMCNEECEKEELSHWTKEQKICMSPMKFEDFTEHCFRHQDDKNDLMMRMIILLIYKQEEIKFIFGNPYCHKQFTSPVTDKILVTKEITSDDEIPAMARDIFGFEINHDVRFFNR